MLIYWHFGRTLKVLKWVSEGYPENIGQLNHYVVFGTKPGALQDFQRGKKSLQGSSRPPLTPPQGSWHIWPLTVGPRTVGPWTIGPTVRGTTVQCPGRDCPGPTVRGPTVWGPTVWGPICQEPIQLLNVVGKLGPGQLGPGKKRL